MLYKARDPFLTGSLMRCPALRPAAASKLLLSLRCLGRTPRRVELNLELRQPRWIYSCHVYRNFDTVALIKSASRNSFLKIFENFKGLF